MQGFPEYFPRVKSLTGACTLTVTSLLTISLYLTNDQLLYNSIPLVVRLLSILYLTFWLLRHRVVKLASPSAKMATPLIAEGTKTDIVLNSKQAQNIRATLVWSRSKNEVNVTLFHEREYYFSALGMPGMLSLQFVPSILTIRLAVSRLEVGYFRHPHAALWRVEHCQRRHFVQFRTSPVCFGFPIILTATSPFS